MLKNESPLNISRCYVIIRFGLNNGFVTHAKDYRTEAYQIGLEQGRIFDVKIPQLQPNQAWKKVENNKK